MSQTDLSTEAGAHIETPQSQSNTVAQSVNSESRRAPEPDPRSPARVLHVINGEHYSGAERVQDLLAMRLREFGYEVGFACVMKRFCNHKAPAR